jgi:hypothetical protein
MTALNLNPVNNNMFLCSCKLLLMFMSILLSRNSIVAVERCQVMHKIAYTQTRWWLVFESPVRSGYWVPRGGHLGNGNFVVSTNRRNIPEMDAHKHRPRNGHPHKHHQNPRSTNTSWQLAIGDATSLTIGGQIPQCLTSLV